MKNNKKRKKRRVSYSVYGDDIEIERLKVKEKVKKQREKERKKEIPKKFEINKDLIFNNNAEIIAKNILEKIIINVFIEIKLKNLHSLLGIHCSNYLFKEIKSLLSLFYLSYEKENPDNNSTNPWDKSNIPQPSPPELDRWKIYNLNIIKTNKSIYGDIFQKLRGKRKSKSRTKLIKIKPEINENKNINIKKIIPKTQVKDNNYEFIDIIEKDKMKKEALKFFDSFPCYPIDESVFKHEIKISKEEEEQIKSFREELLSKEDNKRKEEKKRKNKFLKKYKKEKEPNEKNKYKGKSIGVTSNGEIIFIKSINVKNLKSDFLEITSNMKDELENNSTLQNNINKNKYPKNQKEKNIEKNINNQDIENYYLGKDKNKIKQEIIIAGSSFENFVPETGVSLKQGNKVKSGGNDFTNKFKKMSYNQFEKTFDVFKETNLENKEIFEENVSSIKSRNIYNNSNQIKRKSNIYNFKFFNNDNDSNKNLEKSSSLPDLFKTNIIPKINNTNTNSNNLVRKHSFNFTHYNNSSIYNNNNSSNINNSYSLINNHKNINNLIKTSSSFKNIFYNNQETKKDFKNNNTPTTTTNFFLNFNKNYKFLLKPKHNLISLKKIQNFSSDIVNDNNWEIITQEKDFKKIPFINILKKPIDKNILRVRSNINEIYAKRIKIMNRLSFRKIEDEIKEYKYSGRGYNKSKSIE